MISCFQQLRYCNCLNVKLRIYVFRLSKCCYIIITTLLFVISVKFSLSVAISANVLELKEVRLWNRNISTDTILISCRNTVLFFAYIKITNFREATNCRQKTYTNKSIFLSTVKTYATYFFLQSRALTPLDIQYSF